MLSNLVVTTQKFVLVIDDVGQEKISSNVFSQLLREQGQDESTIKTLTSENLSNESIFENFLNECLVNTEQKLNVLLPPLSDILVYHRPSALFQFVNKIKKNSKVQRTFLWASTKNLFESTLFLISFLEYMSDLVVHLKTAENLSILIRKPGGFVTNDLYSYKKTNNEFLLEPIKKAKKEKEPTVKPEELGTFKIELDEDELIARNALKLPYEKTSEGTEGTIIYTPDADDDFDDEDPDEDLYI